MWFHQHWEEGKDALHYLLVMLFLIEAIGLLNYLICAEVVSLCPGSEIHGTD